MATTPTYKKAAYTALSSKKGSKKKQNPISNLSKKDSSLQVQVNNIFEFVLS